MNYSITITSNDNTPSMITDELEHIFKNRDKSSSKCVDKIKSVQSKKFDKDLSENKSISRSIRVNNHTPKLSVKNGFIHHNKHSSCLQISRSNQKIIKDKHRTEDILFNNNHKSEDLELILNDCLKNGLKFEQTFEELEKRNYIISPIKKDYENNKLKSKSLHSSYSGNNFEEK
jgi:hypothetical protein